MNTVKWCEMKILANGETIQNLKNGNTVLCNGTSGIYQILNKVNGKSYVGQSVNIKRRWAEHKILSRDETLSLKRAFRKYGIENFEFLVLEKCSKDSLNDREEHYISLLSPEYNRTKGGTGAKGHTLSEETKAVLREKAKSQWESKSKSEKYFIVANNLKGPGVGHHVSDETREKLRARNLGKKQSEETKKKRMDTFKKIGLKWINQNREKPIYCIDLDIRFESIKQAAEILNLNASSISHQIKGRVKTVGGHRFSLCSVETNRDECSGVGLEIDTSSKCEATEKVEEIVHTSQMVNVRVSDKGYIQLLFRAGWSVKAFPVYRCDKFDIQSDGWDNAVRFSPDLDARNEGDTQWVYENLRGVYVIARHAIHKDEYSQFVSKQLIEKLRRTSPMQKSTQPVGTWKDWYAEMAIAKAVKKLAKVLPIGDSRVQVAIAADDKAEIGSKVDYIQTAEQGVVIESEAVHVEDQPTVEDEQLDQYADDIRETGSMADLESVWNGIPKQYKKLLKATLDDQKLVIEKMGAAA